LFTVTFLNKELDVIVESSITSLVCHTCDPDIDVLNKFDPFKVEFSDVELVSRLLLNMVDVVTSEFCSVESVTFEVVELEFVKFEADILEFVSIVESFIVE